MIFPIWKRFLDGMPQYLARHYWWAYLWHAGVWFFDHQPIINLILFGQYRNLTRITLARLANEGTGRMLQMTCVYGRLTPLLMHRLHGRCLHIMDVAPIQLRLIDNKCASLGCLLATRMNAECLGYRNDVFDTVLIFFLLHEMPPSARQRAIAEAIRVLAPNGRLMIVEYAPRPTAHFLYRTPPLRFLLTWLEPFLATFWKEDLGRLVPTAARAQGKEMRENWSCDVFHHFYRISEFVITPIGSRHRGSEPEAKS